MSGQILYIIAFFMALLISVVATLTCRVVAIKLNIFDTPTSDIKTHKISTPYLGGVAVAAGWIISLLFIRGVTNFPTMTLRNLRAVICGALMLLGLGLIDDIKFKGLGFKLKLVIQFLAAYIVVFLFDIRINFIPLYWISCFISIIWIIGITNAFNIIDIMDGLSSGIALIASLAFLFISLPTKMIYVNFCAVALAGAILGFLPFNLSKSKKIFMGDAGSLFIGFVMASLSVGTSYTFVSEIGLFVPLLILAIPIYETVLVSFFRIKKSKLPFLGSKDHYALRLEKMGFSRKKILLATYTACIIFSLCAYLFTKLSIVYAMLLFISVIICMWVISIKLASVRMD
jgi:UDP-GlcNAc:undecaprenyl-phosphate GlcNAc-1-phosphate transferase